MQELSQHVGRHSSRACGFLRAGSPLGSPFQEEKGRVDSQHQTFNLQGKAKQTMVTLLSTLWEENTSESVPTTHLS